MALTSGTILSTQQIPSTSHSFYTTSASTTARPSIHLTGTSLKTSSTFPTPTGPQTSPTSLLSTLSTTPLTPTSQTLNPQSSTEVRSYTNLTDLAVFKHRVCLQHCPPFRSPPRNIRPDHQRISNSTRCPDRTDLSGFPTVHPFSHTTPQSLSSPSSPEVLWSTSTPRNIRPDHQRISNSTRCPDLTDLSGFPTVHPFSHTNSSEPQQPIQPRTRWHSPPGQFSALNKSHPPLTPSTPRLPPPRPTLPSTSRGTSLKTSSTFPTPTGPQTSPTSLLSTLSTLSLTPASQTLNPQSSTEVHSVSSHPSSVTPTLSTTVVRATGPTYTSPLITTATSASHRSFLTSTTSPASLSHLSSSPHPKPTSPLSTNITPTPTNTTGTPVAHTSSATHTSTQTSRTSQSSNTASASNTAHPSVPLPGTSVQITSAYPTPPGAQTSLTSRASPLSTRSLTPTPQSLSSPSSPEVLWSTSTPRYIGSSPTTTTLKPRDLQPLYHG
ncbi:LOW QUALITY PROTEIN: uncharacterized protein LOC144377461 [Ictidomys tridecemlineatus]